MTPREEGYRAHKTKGLTARNPYDRFTDAERYWLWMSGYGKSLKEVYRSYPT